MRAPYPILLPVRPGLALLVALALATPWQPALAQPHARWLERALEELGASDRARQAGDLPRSRDLARRALQRLEQAESLQPGDVETAFRAVQAAIFADDRGATAMWLARYRQRNPGAGRAAASSPTRDPHLLYLVGMRELLLEGRPDRAIATLERMQALAPSTLTRQRDDLYYMALLAHGQDLSLADDVDGAVRLYETAARVAQRWGKADKERAARGNMGQALNVGLRYEEAMQVFLRLRREDPGHPLWHWYVGVVHANQGRFDEAVVSYDEVVRLLEAGRFPRAHLDLLEMVWLRRANCHRQLAGMARDPERQQRLRDRAGADFRRFLEIRPESVPGLYWYGVFLYDELGRPYEALELLDRARELDPVCDASQRYIVQIMTQYGPPPGPDGTVPPEAQAAWIARRDALAEERQEHDEAREEERRARERLRPDGTDGCM